MAGYGIIECESGDIPQIVVAPAFQRLGIGTAILQELIYSSNTKGIKVVNAAADCSSITGFLEYHQTPITGKQYEMIRPL